MPFNTSSRSAPSGANGTRKPSSRNITRAPRQFAATAAHVSLTTVRRQSSTATGPTGSARSTMRIEPIVPSEGTYGTVRCVTEARMWPRALRGVPQALRLGERRELAQRGVLDLPGALAREAEQLGHVV